MFNMSIDFILIKKLEEYGQFLCKGETDHRCKYRGIIADRSRFCVGCLASKG